MTRLVSRHASTPSAARAQSIAFPLQLQSSPSLPQRASHVHPPSLLHLRSFATSPPSRAPRSKTIKDPDHPSGVYFHLLPDSSRYAITFLSQPPSSLTSTSIIGFVTPPSSQETVPIYDWIVQKPDSVQVNQDFMKMMHETLKYECVPQDGLLEYEAALRKDGWTHLNGQSP